MLRRPHPLVACLLLSLLAGCAQYGRVLMEFDSVTGFDSVETEPASLDLRPDARRWPWVVRQLEGSGFDVAIATVFGLGPGPYPLENPSGFVRDRVEEMIDFAGDDLGRTAEITLRLTWLAANDGQTLDQLVVLGGIEAVLRKLAVDPLKAPFGSADRRMEAKRRADWLATLERLAPWQRGDAPIAEADAQEFTTALNGLSAAPSSVAETDRRALALLDRIVRAETDPRLRESAAVALVKVIENTLSDTLRRALVAPAPEVRTEAMLAIYRLSGPAVVPFLLFQLTVAAPGTAGREYDPDEGYRRTLLQVCAGLPQQWLYVTFASGPPPIEYVYDTAARDPSEGLRRVALDALARCLGRPISFDQEWADAWWRERALRGQAQPAEEPPREGPE